MPTVMHHAPGTFCWPELATPAAPAEIAFYTALFGWDVFSVPMESGAYHKLQLDGRDVAAMYEMSPAMREQNVPPHWAAYVSVANADESAQVVKQSGGRIVMGPFDVLEQGRMAVAADPAGATFCLWQPAQHPGAAALGRPGALVWTQLNTPDPTSAKAFYGSVLGWTYRDTPIGTGAAYTTCLRSEVPAGGILAIPPEAPEGAPAHWLSYFGVTDLDASHARALALGARAWVAPADLGGGARYSVLSDPTGAAFGLASGLQA